MIANKFKQMLQDEGAVSPVIGVILMVSVTVVLAAVIGAFVLGIGDKLGEPAPNAQIDFDYNSDDGVLDVNHDGGDSITADNTGTLSLSIDATQDVANQVDWNIADPPGYLTAGSSFDEAVVDGSIASGDNIVTIGSDASGEANLVSGDTVDLQWASTGGDQSTTLGSFEAP